MTYMWQMGRGAKEYRFQTDQKAIADKMKRRQKFNLVGRGLNCSFWIYQASISRPDIAKKVFKSLTNEKAIFNSDEEIFCPEGYLLGPEKSAA